MTAAEEYALLLKLWSEKSIRAPHWADYDVEMKKKIDAAEREVRKESESKR